MSHSKYLSEIGTSSEPWTPSPCCPLPPPWRIILNFLNPLVQRVLWWLFPSVPFSAVLVAVPASLSVSFCDWPTHVFSILPGWAVPTSHNTFSCVRISCSWEGLETVKRTELTEPHSFIRSQSHQCDLCTLIFHLLYSSALNCACSFTSLFLKTSINSSWWL